jgi:hypothetical protein
MQGRFNMSKEHDENEKRLDHVGLLDGMCAYSLKN